MHELKKRQARDREKEVKRREKQMEKDKAEREAAAKIRMEQEAYELQVGASKARKAWGLLQCMATGAGTAERLRQLLCSASEAVSWREAAARPAPA